MTPIDLFLRICFAGFSIILLVVSLRAYQRYREPSLAFVTAAFMLFTVLSLIVLVGGLLFVADLEMNSYLVVLNILILLSLYLSILKR